MSWLARTMMRLALHSLAAHRPTWARAMLAEYPVALADGRGLTFAAGCLLAAAKVSLQQSVGRLTLVTYATATGVLVPAAGYQLLCITGYPDLPLGGALFATLTPGSSQDLYLGEACRGAAPALIALRLLLAVGQLRLAWLVVEGDWSGVGKVLALMTAASITLGIFTGILLIHDAGIGQQMLLLLMEVGTISVLARWSARIRVGPSQSSPLV